ncbi:MAG: hypothetical protein R3F37_04660 [Candidatus Competibacteraceae bacterium]
MLLSMAVYGLVIAHQKRILRQQVIQVLPGASQMQQLQYTERAWQPVALGSDSADSLYAGYDQAGRLVGYAVPGKVPVIRIPFVCCMATDRSNG